MSQFKKLNYIYWGKEAIKVTLPNDQMILKIKKVLNEREKANSKTLRKDFTEKTYGLTKRGDYYELYMMEGGRYYIYASNVMDDSKNKKKAILRPDKLFDAKFIELNGKSLRKAFGFVDKEFKRCIPKQFYYINKRLIGKKVIASSIDASSQYPSGCYGKMPDSHDPLIFDHYEKPTPDYPFAFYPKSGHLAIYGELDTRNWLSSRYVLDLFRIDGDDEYAFHSVPADKDETIMFKASDHELDETWDYFYQNKKMAEKDSQEYLDAKLVMNSAIGCWHRKDRRDTRSMPYSDKGSYQLAHLAAVAIARGNQKILDKCAKIGEEKILHICVDGIIYTGDTDWSDVSQEDIGKFHADFLGCDFKMLGMNLYAAEKDGSPIKFRHASMDLMDGKKINDSEPHFIKDLDRLGAKERICDLV